MEVYYLAHPIAPDEHNSFMENMDSVLFHIKLCHDLGIHVHAPYYGNLAAGLPDSDPQVRADGLEANCTIINGYCGIVLCGRKMSSGMAMEYDRLDAGKKVINFIGLSPGTIRELGVVSLAKQ